MCILLHMSKTVYIHNATDTYVKRELNRIVTKNRLTGTKILVSETEDIDAYNDGYKWQTVCLDHATVCNHRTQKLAREWAAQPDWCGPCQHIIWHGDTPIEECLAENYDCAYDPNDLNTTRTDVNDEVAIGTFYDYYDAYTKEYLETAGASVVRRCVWRMRIEVDQS